MLAGEHSNPIGVFGFNVVDFVERHGGRGGQQLTARLV
jgi:hypothetical protein